MTQGQPIRVSKSQGFILVRIDFVMMHLVFLGRGWYVID